ncbi:Argininosuccinate lyase [termite gut metagenome]|uniref:Argininosuccinate lyase n=1 Tax=termite gut metagenome TaxID=433724 RepID=A0A5J4R7A5_9ZZZZ
MKLWGKNTQINKEIERFTVGRDREMDLYLAKYDVIGSMAHIIMLEHIGLLTPEELQLLLTELKKIYATAEKGEFIIEEGIEDVHSQVELMLTRKLGDIGKKIHSGRSRNDQVLVDLKLFTRTEIKEIAKATEQLFKVLITQSEKYKQILMPGYTHLQIAMPSSFGLWFGAYAESLADDMLFLQTAFRICNRNPLGSAAGYGSSFPLNRSLTTRLLGFESLNYNVVYAQMGRGKMERNVAFALASLAATLSKLAYDACLFNSQNFGFVQLPDTCTTGSSIMPHKKNPDVFELIRAKCNKLQSLPQQIMMIAGNLPSGYFRDLQVIKEIFLPAFQELKDCLRMTTYIINEMKVNEHILDDDKYSLLFSVEEVNRLVYEGMPFRDAYKKVGLDIEAGNFSHNRQVQHTHEGSIGNLCNDEITAFMQDIINGFHFQDMEQAEAALLAQY